MALKAEADLYDTPAEKDEADRADQAEDKIGQVVDDRDRVTGCKRGDTHAHNQGKGQDRCSIEAEALLDLAGNLLLLSVVLTIDVFHVLFSPFYQIFLGALLLRAVQNRVAAVQTSAPFRLLSDQTQRTWPQCFWCLHRA